MQQHSHPAIIDPPLFDAVQDELRRRAHAGRRNYTPHLFSGRIFCAECGGLYGSYSCRHQTVWRCNNRHRQKTACKSPGFRNQTIEDAFVMAINRVIDDKDEIIRICLDTVEELCDTREIEEQLAGFRSNMRDVAEAMADSINTNARYVLEQDDYNRKFQEYEARYCEIKKRIEALERERAVRIAKMNGIKSYIDTLREQERVVTFNAVLWNNTVERVWINPDGTMRFEFKGGPSVEG